ncbi:MAG: type III pantothenate kinase [Bdellovibrionales bacterium]|nr:type III pantothenate kinase [Bdellovibrionales bacterium]
MILAMDVGNSQLYGGVFDGDRMVLSFRRSSKQGSSSDEVGVFLRGVIRENGVDPGKIQEIAFCSVVPDVVYSLRGACRKYFDLDPFVLQAGVKTGLKIRYRNPHEVGADRIADAIAAVHLYPGKPVVIVDLGTATTFEAVTGEGEYLGGAITPGLRLQMEVLELRTSKLPAVEIIRPEQALGRTTVESIQAGLYWGHLGQMRELIERLSRECFGGQKPVVIGTGGFAHLFEKEKVFHVIQPDLVLQGLLVANRLNADSKGEK